VGRLDWGIPLPFAEGWVTYVWFDALTNYVSAAASWSDPVVLAALGAQADAGTSPRPVELWPADIQVIGKDIIKFHAVYWPIMLKAMGLPLPRQVLVHGFWQKDGQRMRKALGNVVDPVAVIDQWGVDAFRYYVVREMDIGADGNWTDTGFQARYHAELANGLGNLLNRSLTMLKRYRQGRVPGRSDNLAPEVNQMAQSVLDNLKAHRLQAGLQRTWSIIDRANQYVDQTEPFRLAKDPGQADQLDAVLYNLAETCRVLAVLLWPFLPSTAVKMYRQLGLPDTPDRLSAASWGGLPPEHAIGEVSPLFPRRDQANPRSA
jgi:methionyl-tRNA synthetase